MTTWPKWHSLHEESTLSQQASFKRQLYRLSIFTTKLSSKSKYLYIIQRMFKTMFFKNPAMATTNRLSQTVWHLKLCFSDFQKENSPISGSGGICVLECLWILRETSLQPDLRGVSEFGRVYSFESTAAIEKYSSIMTRAWVVFCCRVAPSVLKLSGVLKELSHLHRRADGFSIPETYRAVVALSKH